MRNTLWRMTVMLAVAVLIGTAAQARYRVDINSFLQAEVNEVAELTAQSNWLQSQGDALGAALLASYIPEHQAQIARLAALSQQAGCNACAVQPTVRPTLGSREAIIQRGIFVHRRVGECYRRLARVTGNRTTLHQVALLGQAGAERHFASLHVALAATQGSPTAIRDGLAAALALERASVNDLNAQARALNAQGDTNAANALVNAIPQHQQQIAVLQTQLRQMRGIAPRFAVAPVVTLGSRADILSHVRLMNSQMVNTYAVAISAFPDSPLKSAMLNGQVITLSAMTTLERLPA